MRRISAFVLTVSLGLMPSSPAQASPADSPDINGSWKLVIIPGADIDFGIFDVKATDGKIAARVTAAHQALQPINSAEGTIAGKQVTIQLPTPGEPTTFRGVLDEDGKKAKGTMRFRGNIYPSRFERTEDKTLAGSQASPMLLLLNQLRAIKDPKERISKIREQIGQNPDSPINAAGYAQILEVAEAAALTSEEVSTLIGKWLDASKAYGPEWIAETQSRAVKALQGKKAYAALATEMAQAAEKALPTDASTELRSNVANMLASSAKLAGKDAIAAEAEGRAKGYDAKLDAEYHEKVPPFKPETFAGRSNNKGNRVVLMEIFTGAECPPCVAADVAFDALLKTFKPTEFIGLQHHLHIPGPDPLTNTDTVARQGYYGPEIGGTPTVFFNGKVLPGGGGGMANALGKYKEYRKTIDPSLEKEKQADIKLTATRTSDEVKITASAKVEGGSKDARPKLRLVLVEESIRYPGGNNLRFHHNVVRGFPGGVEGKELEKGEGTVETTVKLADLRKAQDAYITAYPNSNPPRSRAFGHPIPPMDLDDLAVVALVQDDADHSIWHAVQVEVKASNP
jgi:hypothetical protein